PAELPTVMPMREPSRLPPPPLLEGLEELRTRLPREEVTESALQPRQEYGWADEGAGVARIPIEKAMVIVRERLKSRAARKDGGGDGGREQPSSANSGRLPRKN